MLFLHSLVLIVTAVCFSAVKVQASHLAVRYINTTVSAKPSTHTIEPISSVSTIQLLLNTGVTNSISSVSTLQPSLNTGVSNSPKTDSPKTTPASLTATIRYSIFTTSSPQITKSNHVTRNSSSTHTSFSEHFSQPNATSLSKTTSISTSSPKKCKSYHLLETPTSYFLVTVTVADGVNATVPSYDDSTVPPQPCPTVAQFTGNLQLPKVTRVTLKTVVTMSRSEPIAPWPSPSPSDKITTQGPAATTAPSPPEVPGGVPSDAPSLPVTPAENVPNPVTTPEAAPTGSDDQSGPGQLSSPAMKGVPTTGTPEGQTDPVPTEVAIGGVTIALSPLSVNIGNQQFGKPTDGPVTVGGQTFTINPSEVIGPETTIRRPKVVAAPVLPTTVAGIPLAVGSSAAVIGGSTYDIGPGATPKTIQIGDQKISVGSDGVGFAQITVPPAPAPSHPITVGGLAVTAVGLSEAIADGTTFKLPSGSVTQTQVVNGQTIKLAASGVVLASTTIGGPQNSESTQIATQGGLAITQIGPNSVVIEGSTFNVASGASPVTATIDGQKVSIGPNGIGVGSTTVYPPFALPTLLVTAGGVTIKESGSVAVIGGETFNIGPKATATTATVDGQTITLGPSGVFVGTETFPLPSNPSATAIFTGGAITFSEVGSTLAIFGQDTFTVGPQATPTETIKDGQTISIGASGVVIGSTTIKAPFSPPQTSIITAAGVTFSEVGSTLAVIGGKTYTVGPQATSTTAILDGKTISIQTNGLVIGASTISAPFSPLETKVFTIGSLTISELGSTLAVVAGSTFTIGPNAPTTTKVVDKETVSLGPDGIGFASTTIPFLPTKVVTVGDITFSEVGSTLAVINGTTFTVGPGAKTTTEVLQGESVSLGPGGIGFKSTTVMNSFQTSTSITTSMISAETTKATSIPPTGAPSQNRNGSGRLSATWLWGAGVSLAVMWLL